MSAGTGDDYIENYTESNNTTSTIKISVGAGKDVFVYANGDGKDIIDYTAG